MLQILINFPQKFKVFGQICRIYSCKERNLIMGLSSSQARLLSITARITDNEYKSQRLSNSKLALTRRSESARTDYIDALNSKMFMYNSYDEKGNNIQQDLTSSLLWQYQPMKNQYALINNADQILVSDIDARNFEETNSLAEFLDRYGLLDSREVKTQKEYIDTYSVKNPDYDPYIEDYNTKYNDWVAAEPPKTIEKLIKEGYQEVVTPAWTERVHNSEVYKKVLQTGCMSGSLGKTNCYMHVLSSLIGPGEHKTSDGHTFTVYDGSCDDHGESWCWNTDRHPVSNELKEQLKHMYPCGNPHSETVDIKYGGTIYHVDTRCDECDKTKTIYQELVDFLWKVHEDYSIGINTGGTADPDHLAEFFHIIEFDFDIAEEVYHEPEVIDHPAEYETEPNPEYAEWLTQEPPYNPPEEYNIVQETKVKDIVEEFLTVNDKDKSQWYTNLWYRMNGMFDPIKIEEAEYTDADDTTFKYVLNLKDILKDEYHQGYRVLDKNLSTSTSWLSDALSHGIISLQLVTDNKNPFDTKFNWTSIICTNATDFEMVDDEKKIAIAEAKYESETSYIAKRDKKLEMEMRELDSEHQSLIQEYESIQTAIGKNIERSYKTFQG